MKAIYSYIILKNFWKQRTDDFFDLARVSVEYTKRMYPTVLYTNKETKEIFDQKGIIFDEYVVDDKLFSEVNEHTYGLSKFVIFENETGPYISLDLDTILFQKINTADTITYGYREIDLREPFFDSTTVPPMNTEEKQFHIDYTEKYYWKYFMLMDEDFNRMKLMHFTDTYPSNSLVVVNNPFLMKACAKQVKELVKGEYRRFTVQSYEQYLLYALLKNYKAQIGFLHEKAPAIDLNESYKLQQLLSFNFLHLDTYDRDEKVMKVVRELEQFIDPKVM